MTPSKSQKKLLERLLRAAQEVEPEGLVAVESLVGALAQNRKDLLAHRERFPALGRIVKDPWCTGPLEADVAAAVAALPKAQTLSVRLDPELSHSVETDGVLGRTMEKQVLVFTRARNVTARVEGPTDRLTLLARLAEGIQRPLPHRAPLWGSRITEGLC